MLFCYSISLLLVHISLKVKAAVDCKYQFAFLGTFEFLKRTTNKIAKTISCAFLSCFGTFLNCFEYADKRGRAIRTGGPIMQAKQSPFYQKHSRIRGPAILTAFLAVILIFLLLALEHQLRPVAFAVAKMKSREICVNVMQKAVEQSLAENPELYERLFKIQTDATGKITSAVCDPLAVNQLQNTLEGKASSALNEQGQLRFPVPLGTLSGLQLLAGLGPGIPVRAVPLSAVQGSIETNFVSGGINQTVLEVDVVFKVELGTLLAGTQTHETVESRVRAAQMLVVGDVPRFYSSK